MGSSLSIVTMTHNRGVGRLDNLLSSLDWQTEKPSEVIVVDTSTIDIKVTEDCCRDHNAVYIKRPREFNMGYAFNIGIQSCSMDSQYIMTCPVDMAYAKNFVETLTHYMDIYSFVLAKCGYLPMEFNCVKLVHQWHKAVVVAKESEISERMSPGACQCFPAWWLRQFRGYNEIFPGPDGVDVDIIVRARKYGLEENWIEFDEAPCLHQWHERSELKGVGSELFSVEVPIKVNAERWGDWE